MSLKVTRLVNRRMRNNALKQKPATRAGVMITGWGYQGKTETVCEVAASFEDAWLEMHNHINPAAVEGTWDLHAPVAYVQTPVTAKPKSTCQAVLDFFGTPTKSMSLPQLIAQVAESLHDHGVKALILDDITRLRMHRADDQDTLDLIRAFMSMSVTLILVGVDIPGSGLLREARWDAKTRHWCLRPSTPASTASRPPRPNAASTWSSSTASATAPRRRWRPSQSPRRDGRAAAAAQGEAGQLTAGCMPEYLMRRTGGVVGLLERLIEDGAQEAMDSGKELLDEVLCDEIVISLDDPLPLMTSKIPYAGAGRGSSPGDSGRSTMRFRSRSRRGRGARRMGWLRSCGQGL
ncbi:AAA family ATPase [Streptomyces olivaceoviridis]|uniref:AAA family ATPase n=1 Tax=Streptomyces olivaceoviridis TaxID=1921 RepID=UPI0036755B71